nr:retrovirus-related Pol polyprotein from transposon TNT 1-94 [Tanacetum cinerariifolium]
MRNKERASWDLGTGSHGMLGEVVVAKDIEEVKKLKILLNIEFDMKDLRVVGNILDMEIIRVQKHDSDYVTDLDVRRSLTGYVFTIGNSVVSWKATLQPSVALSSTKAEYMALTKAAKEGIWLKGLIEDLSFPQDQAIVFCNSMNAICLSKDQLTHGHNGVHRVRKQTGQFKGRSQTFHRLILVEGTPHERDLRLEFEKERRKMNIEKN